jgi:hypothetical protein
VNCQWRGAQFGEKLFFLPGHMRIARSRQAFDFAFRRQVQQRAFTGEFLEESPISKAARELVWEFRRLIKTRDGKKLKDWFGKAEQSRISSSAGSSLADGEDP